MRITNLARFSMFITYIVFNIILFFLFAKRYVYMKFIAGVNIIIFLFMFFKDLCDYLNKKNHLRVDNAYGFYKFVRYFHLTLTFVCFFYVVGLVVVLKAVILQF